MIPFRGYGPSTNGTANRKKDEMLKAGEVYENPVTGERAVIRIGTDVTGGELLVVDLYVQPGGAVMGEHLHPGMEERFTMLRGQVGFRLSGQEAIAEPGVQLIAPPGTPHDWWNAGSGEALVRIEMRPAARFEAMIRNAFGLAQDGKVNKRGMPHFLQLAVFAREFADVVQFTRPPRIVQGVLFGLLTLPARLFGYRGSYPEYLAREPSSTVVVEPLTLNQNSTPPSTTSQSGR
jgi:quercetin dioxygenase-like cupin family protein